MRIFIDLDILRLRASSTEKTLVSGITAKRGDAMDLEIVFLRDGIAEALPENSTITFAAKEDGKYDAQPAILAQSFAASGTGSDTIYTGTVSLSTEALDALLLVDGDSTNDVAFVDLMAEVTWTSGDSEPTSTRTFCFRIHNDVYRGDESTPSALPDPYDVWLSNTPQTWTTEEKAQARANIGAVATDDSRLSDSRTPASHDHTRFHDGFDALLQAGNGYAFNLEGGYNTTAPANYAFAYGHSCTASGDSSVALGRNCTASGQASFAVGLGSEASGVYSIAGGRSARATAYYTVALGYRAKANHDGALVLTDSQNADQSSSASNQATLRFANGYRFLGGAADFETPPTVGGSALALASGTVPTTRTINGYDLSNNRTLTASDVGAATDAQGALADTALQPNPVFLGPFASDLAALRGGVTLNAAYRKTDKAVVWRDLISETIALMGDSITAQGSSGLRTLVAAGYGTWARVFGGAQWDFAINGSVMEFATGGFNTTQIQSTHLPEVLASQATKCVVACGINDYAAGQTSTQTADRLRAMWATLTAAGIKPIATTITPDAANAARQAWIAATNTIIRSYAATDGVTLCDWASAIEVSPGVGSVTYTPDNIHPNNLGASKLGRVLAATLSDLNIDPISNFSNTQWVTTNPSLAGSSGQPSDWSVPSIASGATLNSKTLVSTADGNWWRLDYSNGSADSRSSISNLTANTTTVVGKTVEGIMELQVISGGLRGVQFRTVTTGGTQESYDCQGGDNIATEDLIAAADGIVILRTPRTVVSAGVTLVWPQIQFSGTAVFQIRRAGVRYI